VLQVDTTEARFKLALAQKRYNLVMKMVQKSRLCGRAIVAYLQSKGFPEVALHFVQDPQTRFRLALACGLKLPWNVRLPWSNLDKAKEGALIK